MKWHPDDRIGVKMKILLDVCQKMFDQPLSKSKDLGDMIKFLPGVIVQNRITMQGMAELYRVKPDLLDRLIKSPITPLKLEMEYSESSKSSFEYYILDKYLSGFLQDRERSQLYYCNPIFQHISICRHLLSLLKHDGTYWES